MLQDAYNRRADYLRLSVTDRCNLRCIYCMPSEGVKKLEHADILSYEELLRLAEIAAQLGVGKVRITGGEPLVRKGLMDFIRRLREKIGVQDLSLTTNGVLLADLAQDLKKAGLNRLNISLDTLDRDLFLRITKADALPAVLKGVEQALAVGFDPVKINVVPLQGLNENVQEFVNLVRELPVHVRFIELMPLSENAGDLKALTSRDIKERLKEQVRLDIPIKLPGAGPAISYRVAGAKGTLGFISPLTDHFCGSCNRMRITADGKLLTCLFSPESMDIKAMLRRGATAEEIKTAVRRALAVKPLGSEIGAHRQAMSRIGG